MSRNGGKPLTYYQNINSQIRCFFHFSFMFCIRPAKDEHKI